MDIYFWRQQIISSSGNPNKNGFLWQNIFFTDILQPLDFSILKEIQMPIVQSTKQKWEGILKEDK